MNDRARIRRWSMIAYLSPLVVIVGLMIVLAVAA